MGEAHTDQPSAVVVPLFLTLGGMILSIPIAIFIINCLHKRRVKRAAKGSSPDDAEKDFQKVPTSWKKLLKRHTREEWLELANVRNNNREKEVDVEMGQPEKAHYATRNNVKGRAGPSNRGPALSNFPYPISSKLHHCIDDGRNPMVQNDVQKNTNTNASANDGGGTKRSVKTHTAPSNKLPIINPDAGGYYQPSHPPRTSSKAKPKIKHHLDASLYATPESPPTSPPLPARQQPTWGFERNLVEENESIATKLRSMHDANERLQRSPLGNFEAKLEKSDTKKAKSTAAAADRGKGKAKQEQSHDITHAFNMRRHESQAKRQRVLESVVDASGSSRRVVVEEDDDLAFSNAELQGHDKRKERVAARLY